MKVDNPNQENYYGTVVVDQVSSILEVVEIFVT